MTYVLLATTFGNGSAVSSAWPLFGQLLFGLGALVLVVAVVLLLRTPEAPAPYAGYRRR